MKTFKLIMSLSLIGALLCILALALFAFSDRLTLVVTKRLRVCAAPCRYFTHWITLGDIIDAYGPPERVAAFPVSLGDTFGLAITLFYPTEGLTVYGLSAELDKPELRRDEQIIGVEFWDARTLQQMAEEFKHLEGSNLDAQLDRSSPWPGFGPITPIRGP